MRLSLSLFVIFLVSGSLSRSVAQQPDTSELAQDVVLRFGGDVLLGGYYEHAASDSVAMAFESFSLLKEADLAMVNLENPITTRGKKVAKPYNFRMHPRFIEALKVGGIDVVNLANNHIFDYGREGLFDTISYLDSAGIRHVGGGRNRSEAYRPASFLIKGIRISLLGYYGGGEAPGATRDRPGVARRELGRIVEEVHRLRNRDSASVIIVNLHWGVEKARIPEPSQRQFARRIVDAGADAVIGHHPHVLQGIERYKHGVIVYSLGNFIFGGNSRDTYDTGVFEMRLNGKRPSYQFVPVGVRQWRARLLSGTDAHRVLNNMKELSKIFPNTIF